MAMGDNFHVALKMHIRLGGKVLYELICKLILVLEWVVLWGFSPWDMDVSQPVKVDI